MIFVSAGQQVPLDRQEWWQTLPRDSRRSVEGRCFGGKHLVAKHKHDDVRHKRKNNIGIKLLTFSARSTEDSSEQPKGMGFGITKTTIFTICTYSH